MVKHCTQCGEAQDDDARFCPRCGAPQLKTAPAPVEEADPLLGKVIAERYLVVERIGRGASGTIYRGEHTTLHKKVAVKVLHPQLSRDDTALERFRREATTVGQLDNDHILQVLDFGRADAERLFFAMEYLEGEPLSTVIDREGNLLIPRVSDILTQVGEALIEAHGLGYIHRDLRPRNVFLIKRRGRADFVKLLDFGLAKLILPDVEAKQTAMGMTFGDPRYMSPEQARGDTLDRRADIYSLGAIAFEALTGVPPYSGGGTFEILKQHLDAPVPRPRDRRADCPAWLDQVVYKALAKNPEERFASVIKFLECLREQKAPSLGGEDADEKAAHAQLEAGATQLGMLESPVAPAKADPPTLKDPPKAAAPIVAAKPEPAKKETLFLSQLPKPVEKPKKKEKEGKKQREDSQRMALARATVSGEMKSTQPGTQETAPAATVVVEPGTPATNGNNGTAHHAEDQLQVGTVPMPIATAAPAEPATPQPAPLPPPPDLPGHGEPSGEWFDKEFQGARAPGAVPYDELEDDLPKRNKGPIIIAAVIGGLSIVAVAVFLLLPKPQHKPVRGEEPPPAPPVAAAPAAPAVAPAAPAVAPAVAPAAPVAAPPAAPAVAEAPATELKPDNVIRKPEAKPEKPEKPEKIEKPAPKVEVARVEAKPEPKPEPKAEKAPAPVKEEKHSSSSKPAKVATDTKKKSTPDGFKDPFAEPTPATTPKAAGGDSAQADFFVKLGRQKLSASDLGAAAANFNKAREYDARNPDAIAGLGEVAFEQGDYNGASVHLKQALKISPSRPRYLVLLGQAYYKMGRAKDAVVEYRKALRLDPGNQEAQHSLEVAERKLAQGG